MKNDVSELEKARGKLKHSQKKIKALEDELQIREDTIAY